VKIIAFIINYSSLMLDAAIPPIIHNIALPVPAGITQRDTGVIAFCHFTATFALYSHSEIALLHLPFLVLLGHEPFFVQYIIPPICRFKPLNFRLP
jgi:hypothetical protein